MPIGGVCMWAVGGAAGGAPVVALTKTDGKLKIKEKMTKKR